MAHYKTLKDIISQDSWNGLDVGKAELMSFINGKTEKPELDPKAIEGMISTLSQKQKAIYNCYKQFENSLSFLINRTTALKQQFFNSFNYLTKQLTLLQERENSYIEYLSQPLTLNDKILDDILKQSFKELTLKKNTAYDVLLTYLNGFIERYLSNEEIAPAYLEILEKYKTEYIELEVTKTTINTNKGQEDFLQALLDNFSKLYKTENNIKSVIDYITATEGATSLLALGLSPQKRKKLKEPRDYIQVLENYDNLQRIKSEYKGSSFISLLDNKSLESTCSKEKASFSKLDALTMYILETPQEDFIRDYKELYYQAKKDLSKYLDAYKKTDKSLLKTTITNLELIDAKILSFDELSDLDKNKYMLQRDYILSKEASTPSQFLIQEKARAGVALAITPPTEKAKELFLKYGDNYSFLPEGFNLEDCRDYQEQGIYYSLNYIFTFNSLLEVYSDIYRVNLLPLTIKTDFSSYVDIFNTLLYQLYGSLVGDKTTLHNKKAILKGTFQPLDLDRFRPDKDKIAEYTEILKEVAKTDLLSIGAGNYLNPFMNNTFKEGL